MARLLILFALLFCIPQLTIAQASDPAPADMRQRLDAIRQKLPDFSKRMDALRARGEDAAYPLVTYTVLENFTGYAKDDLNNSIPNGWGIVGVNGCDATYEPSHDAHSGEWAAKLINRTPTKSNVYGMFENSNGVTLTAGKTYTLSVWAKCDDAGKVTLPVNPSWGDRLTIEKTGGQWKRFAKTFTPAAGETGFGPRVLIEDVTAGVILDDLCLVEGDQPDAGRNLMPNGSFEQSWTAHRVARELPDMETMTRRLATELNDAESGKIKLPRVPRWDGKQRPKIEGPSFIGSDGRPIFFVGYGHFKQVRNDIEKFPNYGIDIVQHGELGPSGVWPKSEDHIDNAAVDRLIDELDRAGKAGVALDFLLSPHYVPDWLFAKYPHLRKGRADFFPYSIYAPEGRALVKKFVDYVVPKIKDKPALLSICLSNEPINVQEPDEYSIKAWHEWLAKRHGDIATLNARWGSNYAKFDDVPQPNPIGKSPEPRPGPAWCDFIRWNGEYFADFHKVFADYVHEVAPEIPVHVKATTWHFYRSEDVQSGDDATLLGNVTNINGNDSVNLWGFNERAGDLIERGTTDFAQGWRENALAYELERSVHDAPVFNSENHFIFDRDGRYIDPMHIRSALWMGAIHGQSATTLWVWERELSNPRSDTAGSIMERPSCAEAVGIVDHDLNRAAVEVTAIQNARPEVLILQNGTSAVWEGKRYDNCFVKLFTALSFTGLKIGFLTERQLEEGKLTDAPVLLVPDSVHISAAATTALKTFKGSIVAVGDGALLNKDEYDKPLAESPAMKDSIPFATGKTTWQQLWSSLLPTLPKPAIELQDASGHPQTAVQWQIGALAGNTLIVNLYNSSHDAQAVMLPIAATDVLTSQPLATGEKITLAPLEVRLICCAKP